MNFLNGKLKKNLLEQSHCLCDIKENVYHVLGENLGAQKYIKYTVWAQTRK